MKIRRKTNNCLNCGTSLDGIYNYCPKCGQENNNSNVSFKTLLGDFFNTYLAIDSRFGKSIKPFLFKPGSLTNNYIEGKRVSFAHPVRFYLIISIVYFFVVSKVGQKIIVDDDQEMITVNEKKTIDSADSLALAELGLTPDSIKSLTNTKLRGRINDTLTYNKIDSTSYAKGDLSELKNKGGKKEKSGKLNITKDEDIILDKIDFELINEYKNEENITNNQLYDSLQLGNVRAWEELVARQAIRIIRSDKEAVAAFIFKNLPLMMLILIPIFALILKLLYVRNKSQLYIKHIIHALHLHTFAYFFYGLSLSVIFFMMEDEDFRLFGVLFCFLIVSVYAYLSFRRVYNQNWFKTFIKFFFTGIIYVAFILFFFISEMVISLLLY